MKRNALFNGWGSTAINCAPRHFLFLRLTRLQRSKSQFSVRAIIEPAWRTTRQMGFRIFFDQSKRLMPYDPFTCVSSLGCTVRTEQTASRTTRSATLPMNSRVRPDRLCLARTIIPAPTCRIKNPVDGTMAHCIISINPLGDEYLGMSRYCLGTSSLTITSRPAVAAVKKIVE